MCSLVRVPGWLPSRLADSDQRKGALAADYDTGPVSGTALGVGELPLALVNVVERVGALNDLGATGARPVLLVQDGAEGGADQANRRFVVVVAMGDGAVPSMLSGQAPAGDVQTPQCIRSPGPPFEAGGRLGEDFVLAVPVSCQNWRVSDSWSSE